MKGLFFTDLLEMVEERYGYNTANSVVIKSMLPSNGIYTSAKNYRRSEMNLLFGQLQMQTQLPFDYLTKTLGRHRCKRMTVYPQQRNCINRLLASLGRRQTRPVFSFVGTSTGSVTTIYDPSQQTTCLTEGVIRGYPEQWHQLGCPHETTLPDGSKPFFLSLSE